MGLVKGLVSAENHDSCNTRYFPTTLSTTGAHTGCERSEKAEVVTIRADAVQESFFDNEKKKKKTQRNWIQHQLLPHLHPFSFTEVSSGFRSRGRTSQHLQEMKSTKHVSVWNDWTYFCSGEASFVVNLKWKSLEVRTWVFCEVNRCFL